MVGVPDSTVAVVPYSDDWLRLFEEERTELAEALGASAMSIEHIGSTAVPGLAAKPTIDILLVTDDPQRVLEHRTELEGLGYDWREHNTFVGGHDHLFFRKVVGGKRTHHLHVLRTGSPEIENYRLFRDALRSDEGLAQRYQQLKTSLAAKHADDRMGYVEEKAKWVDALVVSLRANQPRWETDQRDALRTTFDEDADAYARSRPVAPGVVFDEAVQRAALAPGSSVVEVGPGTGQATRQLAERGLRVLALELGSQLANRARSNLAQYPNVMVLTTSFEDWDPGGGSYDAVFACNSFHWIDSSVRFAKSAELLHPTGHLVVLSTPWVIPPCADRFWWEVQDDWEAVGAERVDPATKHPDLILDLRPAVRASGMFEEPTITRRLFDVIFTADDYATNLSTQSSVKELPPAARAELIERVRRRIRAHGGHVTAHLLALLTVARRGR